MTNLRQAAQQALESMDDHMYRADTHEFYEAKEALRAALAEPEQEPFCELTWYWYSDEEGSFRSELMPPPFAGMLDDMKVAAYGDPSQSKPVTDEQERKKFESWYACNAFDYERNPIGSRDCGLQWAAWQARAKAKGDSI